MAFTIDETMPSNDYHAIPNIFSSSQLKTIIESSDLFYKKYITKEIGRESIPAFDVGTYFHTSILEPDKLNEECAVYDGPIRRGKAWDAFAEANKGKAIITQQELAQANLMIKAIKESKIAKDIFSQGRAEISAMGSVLVDTLGDIYHEMKEGVFLKLSPTGWKQCGLGPDQYTSVNLKVRADWLRKDMIADLKSTTGDCTNEKDVEDKVSKYDYDLSAAFYLDMFSLALNMGYERFIWVFASKDVGNTKCWEASRENIAIGRAKWRKAVVLIARGMEANWTFEESLDILGPKFWEKEWLKEMKSTEDFKEMIAKHKPLITKEFDL